jgi:hypothetical protein
VELEVPMAKVELAAGGWYAADDIDGVTVDEVNENLGGAAGGGAIEDLVAPLFELVNVTLANGFGLGCDDCDGWFPPELNENDEVAVVVVVGLARIVGANGLFGADDAVAGAADDGVFDAVPAPNFLQKGDKKL